MIKYRLATPADIPQLLALLREIMEHHGTVPPEPERQTATIATILEAPDHLLLVADDDGRLIAMCALIFSQSTWSAAPVCELQDVLVTEDRRGNEVGRELLRTAEELARSRDCARLYLWAEPWNLKAHSFYRSLGLAEKTCLYFERDLHAGPS